jgi:hypothetical protein
VSLQILKALIQTCHRDLNIFSKHIVKILSMLLDTRDLELIDLTCETVKYILKTIDILFVLTQISLSYFVPITMAQH